MHLGPPPPSCDPAQVRPCINQAVARGRRRGPSCGVVTAAFQLIRPNRPRTTDTSPLRVHVRHASPTFLRRPPPPSVADLSQVRQWGSLSNRAFDDDTTKF